jgi:hypothetical protein
VITFVSPYIDWDENVEKGAIRSAAAVSAVSHMEEVGLCVVDTLLQIVAVGALRPRIPTETWAWLKARPSVPPGAGGGGDRADPGITLFAASEDLEISKFSRRFVFSHGVNVDCGGTTSDLSTVLTYTGRGHQVKSLERGPLAAEWATESCVVISRGARGGLNGPDELKARFYRLTQTLYMNVHGSGEITYKYRNQITPICTKGTPLRLLRPLNSAMPSLMFDPALGPHRSYICVI